MLAAVFGSENTISPSADGTRSVFAADMDADGDMDVLSASSNDDKIADCEKKTISTKVLVS